MSQTIEQRIEALESKTSVKGDEEYVLFLALRGCELPKTCKKTLLAQDRAERPEAMVRFIIPFERGEDGEFHCRVCGKTHMREGGEEDVNQTDVG